jgi:hypothetical protein
MTYLTEEVDGCLNAVGASPTPSVDHMLKVMTDMPISSRIFTYLVGFDG